MNNTYDSGAGSPHTLFDDNIDTLPDFDLDLLTYGGDMLQQTRFGQSLLIQHQHCAVPGNLNTNEGHADYFISSDPYHQHHLSTLTQSSGLSSYRSSGSSFLSDQRYSAISNISGFSNTSVSSNEYSAIIPEDSQFFPEFSATNLYPGSPVECSVNPARGRRTTPRNTGQEKDYFKTCLSRTRQRSRRQVTAQIYFCTACREPFKEKADWKRHEEEYQERREKYCCSRCPAVYFLDKNFVYHHKSKHDCQPCAETITKCSAKQHVQDAKSPRKLRTGWGCGFCYHFSDNWTERCNHIAYHFDHEHKTMMDWNHSIVIYSLLQRPAILSKWQAVLKRQRGHFIGFIWDSISTGRVEGYPESNKTAQLQDVLEYFTPGQDATQLAQWAFSVAVPRVARQRTRDPPPVPPKDHVPYSGEPLSDITNDTNQWNQLARSFLADDMLPIGVTQLSGRSQVENNFSWMDCI